MRVDEALAEISRLFLDTAPVVYFVEENPEFFPAVSLIFGQIEDGTLVGITAPITLAECLVIPYRDGDVARQQAFVELLTNTENIEFAEIGQQTGQVAAGLRARYNLQLLDSLQIAMAVKAGCEAFLTNDRQLQRVTELRIVLVNELEV